ncbi:MAG: SMP-30/gluconolactonase/LRE family protein [Erysipelotrichaceae bacterium]
MNKVHTITKDLQLAEGPIWDELRNTLHFIDIDGCAIYSYHLKTKNLNKIIVKDKIGCIVLDQDNQIIAGVRNELIKINPETHTQETICMIDQSSDLLLNDGKCDVYGNLWVGAMAEDLSQPGAFDKGVLYCISQNKVVKKYDGYAIPNGMDWTLDGKQFYHVDSFTNQIFLYDIKNEIELTNKRIALTIDETQGGPDGMCVDAQGNIWVAMWNGKKVCCFEKNTKEIIKTIDMDNQVVTCIQFAGNDLSTLFITTSAEGEVSGGLHSILLDEFKGMKTNCYQSM